VVDFGLFPTSKFYLIQQFFLALLENTTVVLDAVCLDAFHFDDASGNTVFHA
jgi:hypothetical protein